MKTDSLKYVVGEVVANEPAYMRFYGRIDECSTRNFNDEFLWLQDYVKPSKIVISINSEGGSVLHGMGTYSIIQNSPIETETIIEGLAASMGSVLWVAGTRSYMRDYSILMIHNPFLSVKNDEQAQDENQMVEAFRKQIETIYTRRFGLSKDKVREIMEGGEGCDGTYLDAKQAVAAGILPAENIIKTSKQVRTKVKNQIEGLVEAEAIQEVMASINTEIGDIKPLLSPSPIPNQNHQIENSNSQTKMEKEQELLFGSVCAQLGLEKSSDVSAVITRITALVNAEAKVKDVQAQYDALKIQKEGLDAQLTNVQSELSTVKSELQQYKDAEKAQHDAAIAQFIDDAVKEGKITEAVKSKWVEMAQTNFDMVKDTLNSIAARDKISEEIAKDPNNVDNAKSGMTEAEKRVAEAVESVVGKDFKFQTLD